MMFLFGLSVGIATTCGSIWITNLFKKEDKEDLLAGKKYMVSLKSGILWQRAFIEFENETGEKNEI